MIDVAVDNDNLDAKSSYIDYLQLLHESHDIEHHLCGDHLVLLVEATLQHAVLHTRTKVIARKKEWQGRAGVSHSAQCCVFGIRYFTTSDKRRREDSIKSPQSTSCVESLCS
jgi:hypothetical protein